MMNSWIRPVPRERSGRHMPSSRPAPTSAPTATATSAAGISPHPGPAVAALRKNAVIAPMVTSSPCAKLIRFVVPKISESPMAVIAMIAPNLMPATVSRASSAPVPGPLGASPGAGPARLTGRDEGEEHGALLAGTDRDLRQGRGARLAQDHIIRKRGGVERDVVRAGPGQQHLPRAIRPGRCGPHLLAVPLDGDRHAGHRLARRVAQRAPDRRAVLRGGRGGCRQPHNYEEQQGHQAPHSALPGYRAPGPVQAGPRGRRFPGHLDRLDRRHGHLRIAAAGRRRQFDIPPPGRAQLADVLRSTRSVRAGWSYVCASLRGQLLPWGSDPSRTGAPTRAPHQSHRRLR